MSNKNFFKKILYFLGIEDEIPQETEKDDFEPYNIARPEPKPIGRVINIHQTNRNKVVIYKPDSFEEVREITDEVKNRKSVIVNLEKLDKENAKRILDFMAGSIYALDGTVRKIGLGIFLFAPENVDVAGLEPEEENQDKSPLNIKIRG